MNEKKDSKDNLIILVGGTSKLGAALLKKYSLSNNNKIILACRDISKFNSTTSFFKQHNDIEFFKYDALLSSELELVKYIESFQLTSTEVIYLSGMKEIGINKIDDVIKVNFTKPILLYEILKKNILNFSYIVIGSQGDIHSSPTTPSYNATKKALSNYFEYAIHSHSSNHSIYFIKPWLFSSDMTNNSKLKSFLSIDVDNLASLIIKKSKGRSKFIILPRFTYYLVIILRAFSKKILYMVINK